MLGKLIGEDIGKVTTQRVLASETGPKVEVSFQAKGKLLGIEVQEMGTYVSSMTPAGVLQGQGQGVLTTKDGDMAAWTGIGVGKLKGGGAVAWKAALTYQTASPKLARLNSVIGMVEFEVDAEGNATGKVWEWK